MQEVAPTPRDRPRGRAWRGGDRHVVDHPPSFGSRGGRGRRAEPVRGPPLRGQRSRSRRGADGEDPGNRVRTRCAGHRRRARANQGADPGHGGGEVHGDRAADLVLGVQSRRESVLDRLADRLLRLVVFTGDAEAGEERAWNIGGPVTLLQVGHHGSATSSTATLLDQARPKYAVISAGHPDEATNRKYCHPRKETIDELTARLGGAGTTTIRAFASTSDCGTQVSPLDWSDVPASDRLWTTSRDGDVVLTTTGNGAFQRR